MKLIVTHRSPDLDAITSVWLIKRFLQGWQDAEVEFVPAGDKLQGEYEHQGEPVETLNGKKTVHVDTGLGALDHHQTQDNNVCAASRTYDFVKSQPENGITINETRKAAVKRIVDFSVDIDHFQEVFFSDPTADVYDLSIVGIIDGIRMETGYDDTKSTVFVMSCLDALLQTMENKIWAENELSEKGIEFETKHGKGIGIETINDTVLKLAQKKGYVVAIRKDPHSGNLRIKTLPEKRVKELPMTNDQRLTTSTPSIDLTPVYEKVKEMDPDASWYFHVSKKMLLNGSSKNPTMRGSKITLKEAIEVVKDALNS